MEAAETFDYTYNSHTEQWWKQQRHLTTYNSFQWWKQQNRLHLQQPHGAVLEAAETFEQPHGAVVEAAETLLAYRATRSSVGSSRDIDYTYNSHSEHWKQQRHLTTLTQPHGAVVEAAETLTTLTTATWSSGGSSRDIDYTSTATRSSGGSSRDIDYTYNSHTEQWWKQQRH